METDIDLYTTLFIEHGSGQGNSHGTRKWKWKLTWTGKSRIELGMELGTEIDMEILVVPPGFSWFLQVFPGSFSDQVNPKDERFVFNFE